MGLLHKYLHIQNLNSPDVEGILDDTIIWSYKLDGTNASIWWDTKNNCIAAGSRNRQLSAKKDNAGFYAWVISDDEEALLLRNFVFLQPEYIIMGEFLGTTKFVGSIKTYNQEALNKLWVFDIYDIKNECYLPAHEWREKLDIAYAGFDFETKHFPWYIPCFTMENPTIEKLQEVAENNFFLLDNSNIPGEGIVIERSNYRNQYGNYEKAKYVRDSYKEEKAKSKKIMFTEDIESNIIKMFVTNAELAKAKAKVELETGEEFSIANNKHIGMFLNMIWNDAVLDEIKTICKKFKNPTIEFKRLRKLCDLRGREFIGL